MYHLQIMKKLYRIFLTLGGVFLVVTITGGILVSAYKDDIQRYILNYLNEHLNTKVDVDRVNITMLRHFPYISATFRDITILSSYSYRKTNPSPDTLLTANEVILDVNIYKTLLKKDIKIERIIVHEGRLRLVQGVDEKKNWEIVKTGTTKQRRKVHIRQFRLENVRYRYKEKNTGSFVEGEIVKGSWDEGYWIRKNARLKIRQKRMITGEKNKRNKLFWGISEISVQMYPGEDTLRLDKGKISAEEIPQIFFAGNIYKGNNNRLELHFETGDVRSEKILQFWERITSKKISDPGGTVFVKGDLQMTTGNKGSWRADLSYGGEGHHVTVKDSPDALYITAWKGKGTIRSSGKKVVFSLSASPVKMKYGNSFFTGNVTWSNRQKMPVLIALKGKMDLKDANIIFGGNRIFRKGSGETDIELSFPEKIVKDYQEGDWRKIAVKGSIQLKDYEAGLPGPVQGQKTGVTFLPGHLIRLSGEDISAAGSRWHIQGTVYHLDDFIEKHSAVLIKGKLHTSRVRLEKIIDFFQTPEEKQDPSVKEQGKRFLPVFLAGFRADTLQYEDVKIIGLQGTLAYNSPVLELKEMSFHTLGGKVRGGMTLRFLSSGELSVITYGEFEHIDVHGLFRSFHDFNQEFIRAENLKGRISGNVALQATFDTSGTIRPETILSDSYISLEQGELIRFEPLYKLSKFIHLSELQNIRFSRLENEIFISDSRVIIPDMTVRSSAVDLDIAGTHYFDKHFKYRIRIYLSDYLARKVRRSNRNDGLDIIEEEGERNSSLFLIYKGDAENSKVYYDKERTRQKIAKEIKKEKEELKTILREDIGIFKKDTSFMIREEQPGKTFRVEWPEEESEKKNESTTGKDTSSGIKFKVIWEEEPDSIPKKKPVYR